MTLELKIPHPSIATTAEKKPRILVVETAEYRVKLSPTSKKKELAHDPIVLDVSSIK